MMRDNHRPTYEELTHRLAIAEEKLKALGHAQADGNTSEKEFSTTTPCETLAQSDRGENVMLNPHYVNQMLARTERIAHIGSWEWDSAFDRVRWSEELFRIFKRDPAEGAPSYAEQASLYVPEDVQKLRQAVDRCMTDRTPYKLELRVIQADGRIRHCLARGQAVTDAQGRVHRLVGTLQDITDRKEAEEKIRAQENYLYTILQTTPDGFLVLNADGVVVETNDAYCAMSGYARNEVIGMRVSQLAADASPDSIAARVQQVIVDGSKIFETRHRRKDGTTFPLEVSVSWIDAYSGRFVSFCRDLTRRKETERILKQHSHLLENMPDGVYVHDEQGRILYTNAAASRQTGYARDDIIGKAVWDLDAALPESRARSIFSGISETHPFILRSEHRRSDGKLFPVEISITKLRHENMTLFCCIARDITEQAKNALSLQRTQFSVDNAPFSIFWILRDGRFIYVNKQAAGSLGYTQEELLELRIEDVDPHYPPEKRESLWKSYQQHGKAEFESEHRRKDGAKFPVQVHSHYLKFMGEEMEIAQAQDITERKKAEQALRESERKLRNILVNIPQIGVSLDSQGRIVFVNNYFLERTGWTRKEILGRDWFENFIPPDLREEIREVFLKLFTGEEHLDLSNYENDILTRSGEVLTVAWSNLITRDSHGNISDLTCLGLDLSDRKRTEEALKESEARNRLLSELTMEGILLHKNGIAVDLNPAIEKMTGYKREELLQKNILELVHEEDLPIARENMVKPYARPYTIRIARKNGSYIFTEIEGRNFQKGNETLRVIAARDVSARKALEDQLLQAQKMESVGRLAGGVAHDFNNMIGVILGHTEMAMDNAGSNDDLREDLKEIYFAAKRSADITRQLLAFARKQTISPKVLDLNTTVEEMLKMLRRLIGEDIELVWRPAPKLWPVWIDPTQLDQILANLCINARDAIAGVGNLTIETKAMILDEAYCAEHPGLVPGEFVLMTVSDDGCGMDRQILVKLFEPFFTTKKMGQGTGLGLATVYGIVKQNDGLIDVTSQPGQGTTFYIYLPAHKVTRTEGAAKEAEFVPEARRGETILLVEDEPATLRMATMILEKLGYTVLTADMPTKAITLAHEHADRIHLLMTDVIMPEMNGKDLAQKLLSNYPDLKCLYMSGYTDDVIARHGILDQGVRFLPKPFSRKDIAVKVRQALDDTNEE